MSVLEDKIMNKRNTLKTDRLDMSFGELMNIFEDGELIISPEYQRSFRWKDEQQTRFIESILLGIPIPPIFVAENLKGKWELVDGLQRMSTILSFFGLLVSKPEKNNLILGRGDVIKELEGLSLGDFPIKLKNTIKRAVCRVEIVRWDSNEDIRYELFNRLNTGSSPLSEQEIRNCVFRSHSDYPVDLNGVLRKIGQSDGFKLLIKPTSRMEDEMFPEELVLRFFAFKYLSDDIKTTIPEYLTSFMRSVSKGEVRKFNLEKEKIYLGSLIAFLNKCFGKDVFRPNGNFAQHIFDSMAYAIPKVFDKIEGNESELKIRIEAMLNDKEYGEIGTNTFSNTRIKKRMERALEIFACA